MSLADTAAQRWPDARVLHSADWRDLEPGRCELVVSVLYERIIGRSLIDATDTIIQDESLAVTHYYRDSERLGDRDDWTRALSGQGEA